MSTGIGDYIHYSRDGYLQHGTTENGNFQMWESAIDSVKKRARKSNVTLSEQDLQKIESALEGILKSKIQDNTPQAKAKQEVIRILEQKFKDSLQNLDDTTGNVTLKDASSVLGKARSSTNIANLVKRVNNLEQIIIEQAQQGSMNASNALAEVKSLQSFYDSIATQINQFKKRNKIKITEDPRLHKDLQAKKNSLNNLIKEFAAYPAMELQKGEFFENLVAALPKVCENVVATYIQAIDREKVSYNKDNFASQFMTKNFGDMLEKTSLTQGKIDVEITWQGDDGLEQLLGASIKNANLGNYYVHVVTGSSLLFMIQDLDKDFVNHFLNLFAQHKGKNTKTFMDYKQQMVEEMRLVLFYKGLTGDNYQRTSANMFIVNDNRTGKVRAYKAQDLIDKAAENIETLRGVQINGKTFNEKISFVNNWSATPDIRISNLLAQVQAAKVSASIFTGLL